MAKRRKRVHLVCNAHLDPVWYWQWEDGLTETLATFRNACDFCEQIKGFVFCHNEALLYQWVEEHDPVLFRRIKRLVRSGKWHIAGGSYIQPDVNIPSGEVHIREFLYGLRYFRHTFGRRPTTAYNFDSFGQAEGYPQILAGCGFRSYVFCRPRPREDNTLPVGPFNWQDRSGGEVVAHRSDDWYLSWDIREKLETYLPHYAKEKEIMILWGFGNHGGGANRELLDQISRFAARHPEYEFVHSTPEAFFESVNPAVSELPIVSGEMQTVYRGCYTSMNNVKRAYRNCENQLFAVERMAAMAWWLGRAPYPTGQLDTAWKDVVFSADHNVLSGAAIPAVECDSLAQFGRCSQVLRSMRARLFLKLVEKEPACRPEETAVFVWNPHGFPVQTDLECEFNYSYRKLPLGSVEMIIRDAHTGRRLCSQQEQPAAPFEHDWRVRLSVPIRLEPFQMRRLEASWKRRPRPVPWKAPRVTQRNLEFLTDRFHIKINPRTGLVDFAAPCGQRKSFLKKGALLPTVWADGDHAYVCGDDAESIRSELDAVVRKDIPWSAPPRRFRLATREEAAGIAAPGAWDRTKNADEGLEPIRIIEQGPVRTIVEAIFVLGRSAIIRHYVISQRAAYFEVRERVLWFERDAFLKIALPSTFAIRNTIAETPYSATIRPIQKKHLEQVTQRWMAATEGLGQDSTGGRYAAVLNAGSYGYSVHRNTLYLSLLRSPAYGSFGLSPDYDGHRLRYRLRLDQGEHEIRYALTLGENFSEPKTWRSAQIFNMPAEWFIFHPTGKKTRGTGREHTHMPFIRVTPCNVQITAVKKQEDGNGLVVRLHEQAGRRTKVRLAASGTENAIETSVSAYGLKTLVLTRKARRLVKREGDLLE